MTLNRLLLMLAVLVLILGAVRLASLMMTHRSGDQKILEHNAK